MPSANEIRDVRERHGPRPTGTQNKPVTMVVESLDRLRVCEARVMDNMESGHPALGGPGNVFYFVADLAAATAWYSARLGTAPVTRAPQLAMFEVSGTRLTVHVADEYNQPGPSGTVPYWTVSDVDATVREWSEQGASAHRGPKTIMTGERLCQMLDPFGNLFGLRQPPA